MTHSFLLAEQAVPLPDKAGPAAFERSDPNTAGADKTGSEMASPNTAAPELAPSDAAPTISPPASLLSPKVAGQESPPFLPDREASLGKTESIGIDSLSPIPDSSFTWGGYMQAIGMLIVLLVALWAVLRLVRRLGGSRWTPSAGLSRQDLRLEAQLPLGPRKGIMVVRFLNKRLVLGVTEQQMTLLTEMDVPPESQNEGDGADSREKTDAKRYSSTFQRLLAQAKPAEPGADFCQRSDAASDASAGTGRTRG